MHAALATSATVLSRAPAFARAAAPTPSEMRALGTTRVLRKDEALFGEGDRAVSFYKVVSGAVRTFKLLSDGRRQIDAFHLPGDIFGIEAGEEHRFSAEAAGDAVVVAYRRCGIQALAAQDGAFTQEVLSAMMRALERAQDHMLLLGRKSALERIAAFLLALADRVGDEAVELPMCRTDIADHLGLTIETVSRSLTQLERQGTIALPAGRRTVLLRDRAALERLDA